MSDYLWELFKGYDVLVIGGVMCVGLVVSFAWGFVLGLSQVEIETEE